MTFAVVLNTNIHVRIYCKVIASHLCNNALQWNRDLPAEHCPGCLTAELTWPAPEPASLVATSPWIAILMVFSLEFLGLDTRWSSTTIGDLGASGIFTGS